MGPGGRAIILGLGATLSWLVWWSGRRRWRSTSLKEWKGVEAWRWPWLHALGAAVVFVYFVYMALGDLIGLS